MPVAQMQQCLQGHHRLNAQSSCSRLDSYRDHWRDPDGSDLWWARRRTSDGVRCARRTETTFHGGPNSLPSPTKGRGPGGRPLWPLRGVPVAAALPRLGADVLDDLDQRLAPADAYLAARYPGDAGGRQPVHTVYVPADLMTPGLTADWGTQARAALDQHAASAPALAEATGVDATLVARVFPRVLDKLAREPIEDLRLDFEDGYGARPDEQEDHDALAVARALATEIEAGTSPSYVGLRIKCLEAATRRRGLRTLDLFLSGLLAHAALPDGFVVTLPKVTDVRQVEAMAVVCGLLEQAHGMPARRLRFEIQVETPQSVLAADGTAAVARMIHVADGRCSGLPTAPTTTAPPAGSLRPTRAWSTLWPITRRRSCRWPRPRPASACPTGPPTCCRSATPRRCTRRGGCTPAWSAGPWCAATGRAGTCTRPSCPPATWRPTPSSGRVCRRRRPGCGRMPNAPPAACSTSRPRHRRWPGSWPVASTARRWTRPRSRSSPGWTTR